jgi:hypothetical protein
MATDIKVQIFVDPASLAWGTLRDISVSGGFLETQLNVSTLSTLRMTVPAARASGAHIVRAIVIRSDDVGVGVEWCDGDAEVVKRLIEETRFRYMRPVAAGERPASRAAG